MNSGNVSRTSVVRVDSWREEALSDHVRAVRYQEYF